MAQRLGGGRQMGAINPLGGTGAGQQAQGNPALAALRQSAGSTSMRGANLGGLRGGNTQPAPYQPSTALTSGQDANYNDWFKNNDANATKIQDIGNRNIAAMVNAEDKREGHTGSIPQVMPG